MHWKKHGRIFVANKNHSWMHSHASNAVLFGFRESTGRIYFTCRDNLSQSHIAYVDVDFDNNFEVVEISKKPVLAPGRLGLFDDSGVVMSCFQKVQDETYLYYLGWNLKVTVPWLNSIGRARLDKKTGHFIKESLAPILDRSAIDPYSISYPSIIEDNGTYKMWYGSNLNWGRTQDTMQHVIKYAESKNGHDWVRKGEIAIDLIHENEYALSKPWVIKENNKYYMWYSYRGNKNIETYRIGYAVSIDGKTWSRKDNEVGIDVSTSGWDSEMISYPCVFNWKGRKFMLYNGNNYGAGGFGIAELLI